MNTKKIAILEFSDGLGDYFTKPIDLENYEIFPVWSTLQFPNEDFDSYIITGDYNNISNGLLPIHHREMEFISSISDKKIFCSCFSHQLMSLMSGCEVGKRAHRFLGWYKIDVENNHPIFKGLDDMQFLCLNVDEVMTKPANATLLATNPECRFQAFQYGDNILSFQSHPEIFKQEGLEAIIKLRESLMDHCPDLDLLVERTQDYADDNKNKIFLENLMDWLLS